MHYSTPGSSVLHYLPGLAQIHVHWTSDAIYPPTTSNSPRFMDLTFQVPMQYFSLQHRTFTFTTRHIHNWASFPLWPRHIILSGTISNCPLLSPSSLLDTFQPAGLIFQCYKLCAFSYCPWGSCGKNTEVVCHSLLQWTMFCQNSSLWPVHFVRPCMARLIASLSYASHFTTRLWSMKRRGKQRKIVKRSVQRNDWQDQVLKTSKEQCHRHHWRKSFRGEGRWPTKCCTEVKQNRVSIWSTTKKTLMILAMAASEERQGQRPEGGKVETVTVNSSFRSLTIKGRELLLFKMAGGGGEGRNRLIYMIKNREREAEDTPTPLPQQQRLPSTPLRPSQLSALISPLPAQDKSFAVCCLSSPLPPLLLSQRNAGPHSRQGRANIFWIPSFCISQELCFVGHPFSLSPAFPSGPTLSP